MSRSRIDVIGIGISSSEFAVARRAGQAEVSAVRSSPWPAEDKGLSADMWSNRLSGMEGAASSRTNVTIASDLVRWWVVDAPPGTASLRELRQVAALRFEQLFDEAASGWALVGDWSTTAMSVCCAVPAGLATGLQQAAVHHGWKEMHVSVAAVRLRELGEAAPHPSNEPWVWASVVLDRATLWWYRREATFKVVTIGVDVQAPWERIAQEIRRVGSLWPDGALPRELHWASAAPVPPFTEHDLRAVCRLRMQPLGRGSVSGVAALAACMGCE